MSHIVASSDDPVAWAQQRADRVERVHLRDAVPGNLNLGIGRGETDFAGTIGALEAGGFTGTYILELETHDVDEQDREADALRSREEIVAILDDVSDEGVVMTRIFDDPAEFTADAVEGFADLYASHVRAVPGGVVRRAKPRSPKVAVIVGGGSGHYPAFMGVVGPGFADGAVVGNIFTSPSTAQAYSVGRIAHSGAGVIFTYGNYAGDVMNFGMAGERLQADGIDARQLIVTDDIASASPAEAAKRRGIAGDFVVFKVLGAAAERGPRHRRGRTAGPARQRADLHPRHRVLRAAPSPARRSRCSRFRTARWGSDSGSTASRGSRTSPACRRPSWRSCSWTSCSTSGRPGRATGSASSSTGSAPPSTRSCSSSGSPPPRCCARPA